MLGEGTTTSASWRKPLSGSAGPERVPGFYQATGPDDETFRESMAELSRQLAEREARLAETEPAAAEARHAALEEYDRADVGRRIWGLSAVVAAGIAVGIAYLLPPTGSPPVPPPSVVAAGTAPAIVTGAPAIATAPPASPKSAAVSPLPPPAPPPAASADVASARPMVPAKTEPAPATASQQQAAAPASNQAPLRRDEVQEVQARLRSFGFNPGPLDGIPGPLTDAAVRRYQEARAQPQTGKVDRDLLERLRRDPAPKVVQP
jgi:hypothetical protein